MGHLEMQRPPALLSPGLRNNQMKDACLGLPKTANCREIASRVQVSRMRLAEH